MPDSPGRSAFFGYLAARKADRRRRALAWALLAAGLLGLVIAARRGSVSLACASLVCAGFGPAAIRRGDAGRWLRGSAGEVETARFLKRLSRRRWVVFHDRAVPGSRANIDHVVIGPSGVWVVDTKSFGNAPWNVVRSRLDTRPVAWEAGIVSDRLGVHARPVVALHAGRVGVFRRRVRGIPVVRADRLVRRFRVAPRRLAAGDVTELARRFAGTFRPWVAPPPRRGGGR